MAGGWMEMLTVLGTYLRRPNSRTILHGPPCFNRNTALAETKVAQRWRRREGTEDFRQRGSDGTQCGDQHKVTALGAIRSRSRSRRYRRGQKQVLPLPSGIQGLLPPETVGCTA